MTNCYEVTPGGAINTVLNLYRGNLEYVEQNPNASILSVYLQGEPGVGKSATPKAIAAILNYFLVDIRANQMSPDDAGGIRMPNIETRTTDWFAPYWMPSEDGRVLGPDGKERLNEQGKPYAGTLLFFDELASADDRVRKPLFGAFLDRNLNGRKIPNNTLIMAGGNESETGTQVFELDNATRTRFITLRVVADFTSWEKEYAPDAKITPTVVAYLKNNVGNFCMTSEALENDLDIYGNPRSWEHVSIAESSIFKTEEDYKDEEKLKHFQNIVGGKVGTEIAEGFMAVFHIVAKMTSLYDLLNIMKKDKSKLEKLWPEDMSQLYALTYSMMSYPKDVETGLDVMHLMDEFPANGEVYFSDMKPAITEVVIKRLKDKGVKDSDITKHFREYASAATKAGSSGPLIKIDIGGSQKAA